MSLKVTNNPTFQIVQRNLRQAQESSERELERLSSGHRINRACDGEAELATITKLKAQVRSLSQATRNASDGVSMIQVAEGGLSEISSILQRLREVSVQSSSDTVGDNERSLLNKEFQQLITGVDQISKATKINYIQKGDGENNIGLLQFHVGTTADEQNIINFDVGAVDANASNIGIEGLSVGTKEEALDSIESIDNAINGISGIRADVGAIQSRLTSAINALETSKINHEYARSIIEDNDVAESVSRLTSSEVVKNSAISVMAQAIDLPKAAYKLIKNDS